MTPSAMIFAAGFGTRMGALTLDTPKPMLKVAGRTLVDRAVAHLKGAGLTRLVANTHYLPDQIQPHLKSLGVTVCFEETILETGGGLRAALPALGSSPVVTMNPDVVWAGGNPVETLLAEWRDDMQALLMLVPSPEGKGDDDFQCVDGQISRSGPYRYTGLQLIRTDRLGEITDDAFSLNAYWDLLANDAPLNGCVFSGDWCDAGTPDGLLAAERMLD